MMGRFHAWPATSSDICWVIYNLAGIPPGEIRPQQPTLRHEISILNRRYPLTVLGELDVGPWNKQPAALLGCGPVGDNCGTMIWLATRWWPRLAIPSHRYWRRIFVPEVLSQYRRVDFRATADAAERRWLAYTGFTAVAPDYDRFAWTNPDWSRP